MGSDAAIVQMATWTAVVAAGCLAIRAALWAMSNRPGASRSALALGLLVPVAGSGIALAAPGDGGSPHPPAVSVDWPGVAAAHRPSIVVRPGDCLWTIAARNLDRPTSTKVADLWPRWWHANRRLVGPDPDLIRPGQRLRPPPTVRSRS